MSDAMLEAECFGGTYKAKVYDNSKFNIHRLIFAIIKNLAFHRPKAPTWKVFKLSY